MLSARSSLAVAHSVSFSCATVTTVVAAVSRSGGDQ
jgi:hypothetical protein